jgi:hypothetical protein
LKKNQSIIFIACLIIPLALLAAGVGVFGQGTGSSFSFDTLRGESVSILGHGLYKFDTVSSASQEVAQDVVTLVLGIPLLVVGIVLACKGLLRGRLLLAGSFGYFLYTYASMSFLTAFNSLYIVYVALFSLSLFGFILTLSGIDPNNVVNHLGEHFPRKTFAIYFLIVAAFLSLAWLKLVIPPMISGEPPAGLESAITMVIQSLDLGIIVPTSVLTAILLLKKRAWGYTLATVVLLKIFTMGAALIAMIINQIIQKVTIDPVVSVFFVLIGLSGMILAIIAFRNIRDRIAPNVENA